MLFVGVDNEMCNGSILNNSKQIYLSLLIKLLKMFDKDNIWKLIL